MTAYETSKLGGGEKVVYRWEDGRAANWLIRDGEVFEVVSTRNNVHVTVKDSKGRAYDLYAHNLELVELEIRYDCLFRQGMSELKRR